MAAKTARKDQYVGETQRFLRNGFGVYNYQNKFFRYEGEWKKGRKHGHGKFVMSDGSYYEGQFKDGEIDGYGYKYYAINNNSYTGEFVQGEPHGQGVYKYQNGTIYEGAWERGKRSGYGTLKAPDNCSYEGFFHENKRHGEGAQTYINGDRYDGDWVQDKRQGHGELRMRDGTIYDGQWRQDLMNGQGSMIHCSGCIYEGIWVNNYPANMATKLVIVMETTEFEEDESFTVRVECQKEDGEVVELDQGRELQLTAGFKWQPPKDTPTAKESAGLFEVIEDLEESPISTPYGYNVLSYPITDQLVSQMSLEIVTSTEDTAQSASELSIEEKTEGEKTENTSETVLTESVQKLVEEPPKPQSPVTVAESTDVLTADGATSVQTEEVKAREETPLPPPVVNQRSVAGQAGWENVRLVPPPPMYRPFVMLDAELEAQKKGKQKSGAQDKTADKSTDDKAKSKKASVDPTRLRPGEYVLMVHDVTTPPFMDRKLEPAFSLITIHRKKKLPTTRESRPSDVVNSPSDQLDEGTELAGGTPDST